MSIEVRQIGVTAVGGDLADVVVGVGQSAARLGHTHAMDKGDTGSACGGFEKAAETLGAHMDVLSHVTLFDVLRKVGFNELHDLRQSATVELAAVCGIAGVC